MLRVRLTAVYATIDEAAEFLMGAAILDATHSAADAFSINSERPTVLVFPNELDAIRYSVRYFSADEKRQFIDRMRIMVWNFAGDLNKQNLATSDLETVTSLMKRARLGDICMTRPVYDCIRNRIDLPYDAEPEIGSFVFACAMMRQNRKLIDLVANSSVRLARKDFVEYKKSR